MAKEKRHVLTITAPAKETPAKNLPDGAVTGNGDVTAVLAGSADRVRIHIGKADFWKADGRLMDAGYSLGYGGICTLGLVEILLPQLAYADYKAEQNLDEGYILLSLDGGRFDAKLKITVCAEDNIVLLELDRSHPAVSASISLVPLNGAEATVESGICGDVSYVTRGFDTPYCRFPTYGICALKCVSRVIKEGREHIVWAIGVATNHDSAAYKPQTLEKMAMMGARRCEKLLAEHSAWWSAFWSKSGVELADETLELYWYAGIYAMACCSRNEKFPPGLWGYVTDDNMAWFGDYHLNYNYEAPFYALTTANHTELLRGYTAPLNDFLPTARRFAEEYLGINGAYFPVSIGPLGLETDIREGTKEHGHLFLGQKSNASYASVIPMMHWYATRDKEFAKEKYYDYLLSVVEFWENYLVFEDGKYQIYNDGLNEVCWYEGPDHMPKGHDERNPIVSVCLVKMLTKLLIDISEELGLNLDKIPTWQHIHDNIVAPETFEYEGETILRGAADCDVPREISLEAMYPVGAIGEYTAPELFEAAKTTHKRFSIWDSHNRFCSFYPMAARLGHDPADIIAHIHYVIENRGLPNGMFRYGGGGLENNTGVPGTVNEMLMQSYEGILRLFPCWDRKENAKFHGLRAYGAFVVDGSLEDGKITAKIVSEQGRPLTIEAPTAKSVLIMGDGRKIELADKLTTVETSKDEVITVIAE